MKIKSITRNGNDFWSIVFEINGILVTAEVSTESDAKLIQKSINNLRCEKCPHNESECLNGGSYLVSAAEELRKQIPKKPTHEATNLKKYTCSSCLNVLEEMTPFCCFCGQKIDWE